MDSCSLNQRICQARRKQTKNSKLRTSYTFISLFLLFVHKLYVVVTYQIHARICNSCKQYVVVTYRSIIFTPCQSFMCTFGELIQIGTEQLHNTQIYIYFPCCKFIILLGAFLKLIYLIIIYIHLFQLTCAVN